MHWGPSVSAPTRDRLKEGATLEAMEANTTGDTKIGDGTPWTPTLSVTGGASRAGLTPGP